MAGVEQFVSLAPTALRGFLANAFEKFGIDTAADLCCIMSSKKDAGKVCSELLGDLYTPDFDDALITVWEASKVAGLFVIRKMSEALPCNVKSSASSSNVCIKSAVPNSENPTYF